MELYVLNGDFQRIAVIDEANSIIWKKCFVEVGYCEIYAPFDADLFDTLEKGNYLARQDDDMVCQIVRRTIETNAEKGDSLIAYALDVKSILDRRIVWNDINFSGRVCDLIRKIIVDNIISPKASARAIRNFYFDSSNFGEFVETITFASEKDNVLSLVTSLCNDYGYGFKVTLENGRFVMRLMKSKDKSSKYLEDYVEFSMEYSNIVSTNYEEDDEGYKNAVLVGGEKGDNGQILASYSTASGLERREIYSDSGVSKTYTDDNGVEHTYTSDQYAEVLKNIGKLTLIDNGRKRSFNGTVDTIDTYVYKKDYDIGDIVLVKNDYGIEASAIISSVIESDDEDNGYECEPQFEYREIEEPKPVSAIMTEDSIPLATEYGVALALEESASESEIGSKKISELEESSSASEESYFPMVESGSTKKISFGTLKRELSTEFTGDYNKLTNKPRINSVELVDDKSFEDLGLIALNESEILNALN